MGVIFAAGLGSLAEDSVTVEVITFTLVDVAHVLASNYNVFSEMIYGEVMARLLGWFHVPQGIVEQVKTCLFWHHNCYTTYNNKLYYIWMDKEVLCYHQ